MSMYEDYAKLRKSIGGIQKDGENPHFKNKYVELNTAIGVIDEQIEKHGFICFIQTPINIAGKNYLHTELIHKDGEKITCDLELITTKQDPQMLGSSLTYARRYSLLTMLGLKAEDDDGNVASGVTKPTEKKPTEAQKPEIELANDTQLDQIRTLAKQKGAVLSNITKHYGVAGLPKLTFVMAKDCIEQLKLRKDV